MSGASSRRKGHDFERKMAILLRDLYPNAARGDQTRFGTSQAPDVDGTPYFIECKKGKRTNIKAAYSQACEGTMSEAHRNHSSPRPPITITQDDREHILVTMAFADWKALVKRSLNG